MLLFVVLGDRYTLTINSRFIRFRSFSSIPCIALILLLSGGPISLSSDCSSSNACVRYCTFSSLDSPCRIINGSISRTTPLMHGLLIGSSSSQMSAGTRIGRHSLNSFLMCTAVIPQLSVDYMSYPFNCASPGAGLSVCVTAISSEAQRTSTLFCSKYDAMSSVFSDASDNPPHTFQ